MSRKVNWQQLIREHHEWEAYNFPSVVIEDQLMGVVEEVGELAHHHLKMKQGIRGNEDHLAEGQDAVGDIVIYMLGVMYSLDIREGPETWTIHRELQENKDLLVLYLANDAGTLVGVYLGLIIGKHYHISRFIYTLRRYCDSMGWDFEETVNNTWAKVKQRNWQKDPIKGVSADKAIELLREDDNEYPSADPADQGLKASDFT